MRDAYEVLRQKEADLARVRRETESLKIVARYDLNSDQSDKTDVTSTETIEDNLLNIIRQNEPDHLKATSTDDLLSSVEISRPRFGTY